MLNMGHTIIDPCLPALFDWATVGRESRRCSIWKLSTRSGFHDMARLNMHFYSANHFAILQCRVELAASHGSYLSILPSIFWGSWYSSRSAICWRYTCKAVRKIRPWELSNAVASERGHCRTGRMVLFPPPSDFPKTLLNHGMHCLYYHPVSQFRSVGGMQRA